jgi:hypothetical protein
VLATQTVAGLKVSGLDFQNLVILFYLGRDVAPRRLVVQRSHRLFKITKLASNVATPIAHYSLITFVSQPDADGAASLPVLGLNESC